MQQKILYIINSLNLGGAERVLTNLVQTIDRNRFTINIITLQSSDTELTKEIQHHNISIFSLNLQHNNNVIQLIGKLITLVKLLNPDIIHTNLTASNLSGRIVGYLFNKPVISGIHAPMTYYNHKKNVTLFYRLRLILDYLTDRWTSPIHIACSKHVALAAQHTLGIPSSRLKVIYNGMQIPAFADSTRKTYASDDVINLISVGRLINEKGHQFLIEAMLTIIAQFPKAHLRIAGDGPLRSLLQKRINQLNLQSHVTLLGQCNNVKELLQASDLFIFPSLSEGLPLAPLEALAYGVPVIATNITALQEIIDHEVHGILVEPQNADSIASAVISGLQHPARLNQFRIAGYQRIKERFDTIAMTQAIENLYLTIGQQRAKNN